MTIKDARSRVKAVPFDGRTRHAGIVRQSVCSTLPVQRTLAHSLVLSHESGELSSRFPHPDPWLPLQLCRAALSSTSRFLNHSRDTGITVAMNAPSTPQNSSATLDRPHSRSAHSPPETPRSSAAPALPARGGIPHSGPRWMGSPLEDRPFLETQQSTAQPSPNLRRTASPRSFLSIPGAAAPVV